MKIETLSQTKTVKLPTGKEVERTAKYKLALPETAEEAQQLLNGSLFKWAAFGMVKHAQQVVANKLIGGALGDRKLMRQFNESLRTLKEVMEMSTEAALEMLLSKAQFAKVKEYFDSVGEGEDLALDFTVDGLPEPGSFKGEVDDEAEAEA